MTTNLTRRRLMLWTLLVGVLMSIILPIGRVSAATEPPKPKGSISVSPAVINLSLQTGQQEAKTVLTLTNNYSVPVRLTADWQAIDEATGRLIPSGPLSPELAKSLTISETDILIEPNQTHQVTVSVHNSDGLSPGGHYATLVFSQLASDNQTLGLQSALSVTVFIVKRDGARTSLQLNQLVASHNLFHTPTKADLTLTNTGNVHVIPRAAVTVERNGEVIAKGVVNTTSAPLLPGRKATYNVSVVRFSHIYWPTHLQLRVVYRGDQGPEPQELVSSFWYMPPWWPILVLIIGMGLFFGGRYGYQKLKKQRIKRNKKAKNIPELKPTTPVYSQINISAIEVTPTHTVPVSRKTKQATVPRKIHVSSEQPKKAPKKKK